LELTQVPTNGAIGSTSKVTVRLVAAVSVTWQVPPLAAGQPDHPPSRDIESAVAVTTTTVPAG
jgi:hypothetical protein